MTNDNKKTEQSKDSKPTEKKSNVELMEEALNKMGSKVVKITPPKGFVQVIFKR